MTSLTSEFSHRLAMFAEAYTEEECDGLVRPLVILGEMLSLAFDPITSSRAMTALARIIDTSPTMSIDWTSLPTEPLETEWRNEWGDLDAANNTYWSDTMTRAHNLNGFAFYGIIPSWEYLGKAGQDHRNLDDILDLPAYVQSTVDRLTRFVALFPKEGDFYGLPFIEATCLAAVARLKLDEGKALTVHELAALTQVTTKRLQNAIYAKSEDSPIPSKDGLISPASAQRWLQARHFLPSIWKEYAAGRCWEGDASAPEAPSTADEAPLFGKYLFVPEAKDGTKFGPNSCLRPGKADEKPHYTVGAKGQERDFESYEEALAALTAMPSPFWRRPNENGHFGIVSAERWRRVSSAELQTL